MFLRPSRSSPQDAPFLLPLSSLAPDVQTACVCWRKLTVLRPHQHHTGAKTDPRKALIPTDIFLEALLAAFQHMGVEFDKSSKGANMRITEGDAIIPMLPAGFCSIFIAYAVGCSGDPYPQCSTVLAKHFYSLVRVSPRDVAPPDYQPNRHVPDDGHLVPTDGRRLLVPKAVQHVGVFAAHKVSTQCSAWPHLTRTNHDWYCASLSAQLLCCPLAGCGKYRHGCGNLIICSRVGHFPLSLLSLPPWQHRPNQTAFRGVHGRWDPAPTEPSREHQALWKTQLYP